MKLAPPFGDMKNSVWFRSHFCLICLSVFNYSEEMALDNEGKNISEMSGCDASGIIIYIKWLCDLNLVV